MLIASEINVLRDHNVILRPIKSKSSNTPSFSDSASIITSQIFVWGAGRKYNIGAMI